MFSLVLWEFWSHSLPQLLPDLLCLPIHLNLWPLALFCLFVFLSISSNLYYSDSLGYVVFYQSMVNLPGETVLPNADSPSPELPIDNGSSAGGGSSCFCVPIHAEVWSVVSLWRACAYCHNHREFICVASLLYLGDDILLNSSTTSGSFSVSSPIWQWSPWSWEEEEVWCPL